MSRCFLVSGLLACLTLTSLSPAAVAQLKVSLESRDGKHRLLVDGQPYLVKGVGGQERLAELAAAGGNSIRTWSTENLDRVLTEAHKHGLTVCVGFWLGHERHGFNYQNQEAVLKQLEDCLRAVRKYKDHPAVLMWAIGNEMEGAGKNPAVWYAIDHIARECKRLDPNHPTMTVIAELGEDKLQSIERFCPNVDIIGVNSYGGMDSLGKRYRASKVSKPFLVTEFGPLGPWEVGQTKWGSRLENSSTVKARRYAQGYAKTVLGQPDLCLGSYAFLWGNKQETTATWFGMWLPDGARLGPSEAMSAVWTGKPPKNRCPQIRSLTLSQSEDLKPTQVVTAKLDVADPEKDEMRFKWVLRRDSGTVGVGGDFQASQQAIQVKVASSGSTAQLTIPKNGGAYRLFAYVYDGQGGAAVANAPLYVNAPIMKAKAPQAKLPFALYADGAKSNVFVASGFMGNTQAVSMTADCRDNPHSGMTCLKVEYKSPDAWGGVLWQSPPNDWDGKQPGGLNLQGADALEFWVRGHEGGEKVNFVIGAIEGQTPYRDTTKAEVKDLLLTTAWKKVRIPLKGRDLSRIKTAFGWSLAGQGKPVRFYLDDIVYVKDSAP